MRESRPGASGQAAQSGGSGCRTGFRREPAQTRPREPLEISPKARGAPRRWPDERRWKLVRPWTCPPAGVCSRRDDRWRGRRRRRCLSHPRVRQWTGGTAHYGPPFCGATFSGPTYADPERDPDAEPDAEPDADAIFEHVFTGTAFDDRSAALDLSFRPAGSERTARPQRAAWPPWPTRARPPPVGDQLHRPGAQRAAGAERPPRPERTPGAQWPDRRRALA